jgi:hypothetical protein
MITCKWVREKPLARCQKEVSEKCPFTCNSCPIPFLPFQSTSRPIHFVSPTISMTLVAVCVSLTAFFFIRKKVKMENRKEALRQIDGKLGIESISWSGDRDLILNGHRYYSWDIEMDHD